MTATFTVAGAPRGKQRPKFSSRGGHVNVRTPAETVQYENWVRLAYRQANFPMLRDGAIWLDIKAFYPIPKSVKKADREQIAAGKYKITKGDIDNVIKAISDALNGVAYTDDARIAKISGEKRYSEDARVEVTLYELND